jgi:hypothetical protein
MKWTDLAQDKDQWWALVNTVMNPLGSIIGEEFLGQLSDYHLLKNSECFTLRTKGALLITL